ncbi:MAG: thiolase family protein [Planctomycetes bacterium]|nr:thiolase family protein [Planctomycetota bacterium]
MLKNIFLAGGSRTPLGMFNGAFANVTAPELGSVAIKAALERAKVDPKEVDEVLFGNVIGAGLGQNVARQAALGAGLPVSCGATTINKVCGSSMRAIILAAQAIQCGDADLIVAGGTESMTGAPYLLPKARGGYRMGHGELIDAMIQDGLWDVYNDVHMGTCGDECAREYDITREQQDDFAVESYKRVLATQAAGHFDAVMAPVEVSSRSGTVVVDRDEDPTKFKEEKIRRLKPAFGKDGTVTAGNASGINDGAAAAVVVGEEKAKALGIVCSGRILGHTNVAMEPKKFTIAPVHAIRKLCDRLCLKLGDVDLFEINEAFAVVTLVAMKELDLPHEKVNVSGGAVAMGHPIGATGARLVVTLLNALRLREKKLGIACLCIGGGEASAIAIERCA